jgi:hypothetical protein
VRKLLSLRFASIFSLRFALCSLRFALFSLRFALFSLRFALLNFEKKVRFVRFASLFCSLRFASLYGRKKNFASLRFLNFILGDIYMPGLDFELENLSLSLFFKQVAQTG